jgi:hypothetical protein
VAQDSSFIPALNELTMTKVKFKNSAVATKVSNVIAYVNYTALRLDRITVRGGNEKVKKILSELIK